MSKKSNCVINFKCHMVKDKKDVLLNAVTFCVDCQELYCKRHISGCISCSDKLCHRCIRRCNNCQEFYCKDCLDLCLSKYCYGMYCSECNECDNNCLHNSDSSYSDSDENI